MKRFVVILMPIFLIMFVLILVSTSNAAMEVVVFKCGDRFDLNPPKTLVQVSSSSANAPIIDPDTECAQAISYLLSTGYKMGDILTAGGNSPMTIYSFGKSVP